MPAEVDQSEMDNAAFCVRVYALAKQYECEITLFDWDRHIIMFEGDPAQEHALAVAIGDWLDV